MASLLFQATDGNVIELPLYPGANRVGRADDNQIQVPDSSVSTHHCEVLVENGIVKVRDLGSTNGIAVNGEPVHEGVLHSGSILRVGNVEFRLKAEEEVPIPSSRIAVPQAAGEPLHAVCRDHPNTSAEWRCSKCGALFCEKCITDGRKFGVPGVKFCPLCSSKADSIKARLEERARAEKSFGTELLAAWKYPFRGDGWVILVAGALFFALAGFAQRFMFLIGGLVFVLTTGYWLAYAQKVVSCSANGEDDPPTWPDLSDILQDIVVPFVQGAALFVLYLLPSFVALGMMPKDEPMTYVTAGGLLLVALFMMPMAWLAVSTHESIAGLSPHFVLPSILRIPGHYMVVFVELVVLVAINLALGWALDQVAIPLVPWLLNSFLGLYFMMVMCRLLGVLYFLNRERLGWF